MRSGNSKFDWEPIRSAYLAGDYAQCRHLLESAPADEAEIWLARMESRANHRPEAIARLLKIEPSEERVGAERDIWLAAAYDDSDPALAHRLLDRALPVLTPNNEAYCRGLYTRAQVHYLAGEYDRCLEICKELTHAHSARDRAQAYSLRSWICAKHEDTRSQLHYLRLSLKEHLSAEPVDHFAFIHMLVAFAALCRELPTHGEIDELRTGFARARRSDVTAFSWFMLLRLLGWIDVLQGDEISALRMFRKAQACAPSAYWRVFCIVDRAYLADATGSKASATKTLALAHEHASALEWSNTREDERIILVTIAQLYAESNPARAQAYLAKYRSLRTGMHARIGWVGDRRTQALQLCAHGTALLALDEREEGIAMLTQAWSIFTAFEYEWRAALAALTLFDATSDNAWLERARKHISPWPRSWIARRV